MSFSNCSSQKLFTCILFLACCFSIIPSSVYGFSSFTTRIEYTELQCYYEQLNSGDRLDLSFQVSSGGSLDIDFVVKGPNDKIIHSVNGGSETSFGFDASQTGVYEYCFSNKKVSRDEKVVTFVARGPDERSKLETKYKIDNAAHEPLEKEMRKLVDGVNAIRDEQAYLVLREYTHRKTADSSSARILYWSFLQIGVLLAVCLFQIIYVKGFFQVRRLI